MMSWNGTPQRRKAARRAARVAFALSLGFPGLASGAIAASAQGARPPAALEEDGGEAEEPAQPKSKAHEKASRRGQEADNAQAHGKDKGKPDTRDAKQKAQERYKTDKTYPTSVTWTLTAIDDKPVDPSLDISFVVDEAYRGSGFSGCNTWSATVFPQRGQRLLTGPVAHTKRQCDKSRSDVERVVLLGLLSGVNWDLEGSNILILKGRTGVMRFKRTL